ncbi:propanediol utilization protein PduM [Klebsiella pneumoniae]|uniref:Propanediol utilization protein PduM n=1 Tax=Klebsiella pneumoniae TaxID=573 RepID=A0A378A9J3_KLEPN|nr:propanediol utilization protein PduM [Klebsiella pneumoniae]
MNHAMLQRIVEEVAARLRRRALSTATLSVAQLGEADIRSLLCQHASLRIVQWIYRCWSSLPASVRWRQPVAHCMRRWPGAFGYS